MRGRFAAACAAVLVGLSPAGLPFARLAAVACSHQEAPVIEAQPAQAEPARAVRARRFAQRSHNEAPRAVVFRSPSGPAPSQAPPAA